MNRRKFIKISTLLAAGVILPKEAVKATLPEHGALRITKLKSEWDDKYLIEKGLRKTEVSFSGMSDLICCHGLCVLGEFFLIIRDELERDNHKLTKAEQLQLIKFIKEKCSDHKCSYTRN